MKVILDIELEEGAYLPHVDLAGKCVTISGAAIKDIQFGRECEVEDVDYSSQTTKILAQGALMTADVVQVPLTSITVNGVAFFGRGSQEGYDMWNSFDESIHKESWTEGVMVWIRREDSH